MGKMTRFFWWQQDFVHKGLSAPAPGLYTCWKTLKKVYKIRILRYFFLKLALNGRSDKGFLLTSKVCPQGVFCPCLRLQCIYMYKIIKTVYKIWFPRDYFQTCNIWAKRKGLSVVIKFCPQGIVCPCPRAIYMYKSIKIYTRTRCQVSVYRTTGPLAKNIIIKFDLLLSFYFRTRQLFWILACPSPFRRK